MTTDIYPIAAFNDNYIWIIRQGDRVVAVDPGDATPVLAELAAENLQLVGILITHHHADHTGGVEALVEHSGATVYGPAFESQPIPCLNEGLKEGDRFSIDGLDLSFEVLEVPGHTLGHIAYTTVINESQPVLFCGDSLFSCGCGRMFEGDSRMMLQSVDKFGKLAHNTLVYCAHEYTLSNIKWALAVEPDNSDLSAWSDKAQALRAENIPTVPTTIAQELATNPFLRVREAAVMEAAAEYSGETLTDDVAVFAALREWKNNA